MIVIPISKENLIFNREPLDYSEDFLFMKRWKSKTKKGTGTVMETWEIPIMQKHIDLLQVEGKDVLEIGFGMGISATMIQNAKPKSHTVIESHPDVLNYFMEKCPYRDNVKLVPGFWQNVIMSLDKYDCIFFDTHMDKAEDFFQLVDLKLRENGKFTYFHWENFHRKESLYNVERFPVEYEKVFHEGGKEKGTCQVPLYTKTKFSTFNKLYMTSPQQTTNRILY